MSRLRVGEDIFTLSRRIDADANIGIAVRMTATRAYGNGRGNRAASAGGA
jgi:hypothetical protein